MALLTLEQSLGVYLFDRSSQEMFLSFLDKEQASKIDSIGLLVGLANFRV